MANLSRDEMKAALANGGSVLINGKPETPDAPGTPPRLVLKAENLPTEAELAAASGDPETKRVTHESLQRQFDHLRAQMALLEPGPDLPPAAASAAAPKRAEEPRPKAEPPPEEKEKEKPKAEPPANPEADRLRQDIDRELKEREARAAEEQKAPEKAKADPKGAMKPPDVKGK